jgi:drug/metabolite transporter (DMT)-like permease
MIGPLSTITMGVLILGEPFSGWIAAGTLLVLAGVALLADAQRRQAATVQTRTA